VIRGGTTKRCQASVNGYSGADHCVLPLGWKGMGELGPGEHDCYVTFNPINPAIKLRWICDVPAAIVAARASR
jgi:hypothetical protein